MPGSALITSNQTAGRPLDRGMHYVSSRNMLRRLRYQLILGFVFCVIAPAVIYHDGDFRMAWMRPATQSTVALAGFAFVIALALFRRVISLPGIGIVAHVLPAVVAGFSFAVAAIAILRLNYSGAVLAMSFFMSGLTLFVFSQALRTESGRRFYVVPSPGIAKLRREGGFEYHVLEKPEIPNDPDLVLIGDLHDDLDPSWEQLIADVAILGYPVYHIRQIMESMTGRVQIDHLSENSFGSLIPNSAFGKAKRAFDIAVSLILLPILLPMFLVIGIVIALDSPGMVFFRQKRRGYRGEAFDIIKFRTMRPAVDSVDGRDNAVTRTGDARITRVGRFLRRTRLDELPQIYNILRGEMSWIGPRPEAIPLSVWYRDEIPFYAYRHIVRPGITGWAQINQGHVADLESVFEKLRYDFYYIKNFSAWLDLLIVWRTVLIVFTGFGAK